jgi:hypothetical protein
MRDDVNTPASYGVASRLNASAPCHAPMRARQVAAWGAAPGLVARADRVHVACDCGGRYRDIMLCLCPAYPPNCRMHLAEQMHPLFLIRCLLVAASALLAACGTPTVNEQNRQYAPVVVSPRSVRVTDAFGVVPDTIIIEARNAFGQRLTGFFTAFASATGWIRVLGTDRAGWIRSGTIVSDSSGRIRLLWTLSGAPNQRLSIVMADGTLEVTTMLPRPAVLLVADTAVSSGAFAVCVQKSGRVGCVGPGRNSSFADSALIGHDPGRLYWLRFDAPIASISSNSLGACALLTDGRTSCWDGRPDSLGPSDGSHPPFVELRGTVGRTASGDVWVKPRMRFGAPWIKVQSDAAFTALLDQYNERTACARTADNTVMCSTTFFNSLAPFVGATAMAPVRDARDGAVVRATAGYTAQPASPDYLFGDLIVRRADGAGLAFRRRDEENEAWLVPSTPDSTISESGPRVRACVPVLSATCDPANPWRSVSQVGNLSTLGGSSESGYQRLCGIRGVIVCYRYEARGPSSVDTIRVAP